MDEYNMLEMFWYHNMMDKIKGKDLISTEQEHLKVSHLHIKA